jgi:hypothetical protein
MINKIKNKIKKWLIQDELDKLNDLITRNQNKTNSILSHNEELIKSFLATCQTGYDLGVSEYHKNWCVFVKQGRSENSPDFVKFLDLSDLNLKEIKGFELYLESLNKHRNMRNMHIDAPIGMKDYFIFK